jgi:hypothetical protein
MRWFAEQVRKLYDVVPVELQIDACQDGVHHVTVTEPGPQPGPPEPVTRFRARANRTGTPTVTAMLTVGQVAHVGELLGTTVIDAAAMHRLADHQLRRAFPTGPPPDALDTIGLFDPTIGQGWLLDK